MTPPLELPVLRASHPLSYLAALGTLQLLTDGADPTATLSWAPEDAPTARIHTTLDYDQLVDALAETWRHQAKTGSVGSVTINNTPQPLPPRARIDQTHTGPGLNDPAKLIADTEYPLYLANASPTARRWIHALGTDIVLDADRPTIAMSHLYLLSRQQRLDQQLDALLNLADRADELVHQAFTRWRREPIKSGMNWDIAANRNGAQSPTGNPDTNIVPGATWLAIMALPLFPVTANNGQVTTRGWQRINRTPHFLMPCWHPPLDTPAIETILDHPAIRLTTHPNRDRSNNNDIHLTTAPWQLEALGIHKVYTCDVVTRHVGGQTERYLGDATPRTPLPPTPTRRPLQ